MNRYVVIILILVIALTGCNAKKDENLEKEKLLRELDYFSYKISDMLNNLNNISLEDYELVSKKVSIGDVSKSEGANQSSSDSSSNQDKSKDGESLDITVTEMRYNSILNNDSEDINWDYMKSEIEIMNSSWSIAMIDLYNAKISINDLMSFEEVLNKTIIGIKEEDKITTLANLCNLYSYIPQFLSGISAETYKQNIEKTKLHIFIAYAEISSDEWDIAGENLSEAEKVYLKAINDTNNSQENQYKMNKTYMLIRELQGSLENKDKILFYLKYKTLIESINTS